MVAGGTKHGGEHCLVNKRVKGGRYLGQNEWGRRNRGGLRVKVILMDFLFETLARVRTK